MSQASSHSAEWYLEEDSDAAATMLFSCAERIRDEGAWQWQADKLHAAMYGGARAEAAFISGTDDDSTYEYTPTKLARNVARSAADTYVTKIGKHRPLPEILAHKGNWRDQRRARKMTQLVEGEFDRHKIFKRWARVILRDSAVYGDGYLKIDLDTPSSKTISVGRVLPRELWVDPADAEYGDPRNIYYITSRDLGIVQRTFAPDDEELRDRIGQCAREDGRSDWATSTWGKSTVTRIRLVEAHHLCDDIRAHEELHGDELQKHIDSDECTGRHMIAARGVCLVDEKWPFPRFPYAKLPYLEALEGYRSMGLCERLEGFAAEQNLASEKLSAGMYYAGGMILYWPSQQDIVEEELTNSSNVRILRGPPGMAPTAFNPEPVHPQTLNYPRELGVEGLNEEGISQMSARSQKPAGDLSGVALNTIDDIETERFGMQGYGYAQWCVEVAELFVMWIAFIAKEHGDYTSDVPLRGGILSLSWKDIAIDNYKIQTQPAALMRLMPAARRGMADQLFNAGRIDGVTYLRYIGAGDADIDTEIDIETADRLKVDEQIEAILDAADPWEEYAKQTASPFSTNYEWAIRRAQMRLAQAESGGCDEENLEALREWTLNLVDLKNGVGAPPMGAPGEAPAMLPGLSPAAVTNGGMAPPGAPPMPPMPPGMPPGTPMQ